MKIVLNHLDKANLYKYDNLQNSLLTCDVDKDKEYRKTFKGFYRVRRGEKWSDVFFSILQREKRNRTISFRSVLKKMFEETGRVEASFCSKLIATINPKLPVWDTRVLANLGLRNPYIQDTADRLCCRIEVYSCIKTWSSNAIREACFEEWKKRFDDAFPQFRHFTDMKKLDLFLWQLW